MVTAYGRRKLPRMERFPEERILRIAHACLTQSREQIASTSTLLEMSMNLLVRASLECGAKIPDAKESERVPRPRA